MATINHLNPEIKRFPKKKRSNHYCMQLGAHSFAMFVKDLIEKFFVAHLEQYLSSSSIFMG